MAISGACDINRYQKHKGTIQISLYYIVSIVELVLNQPLYAKYMPIHFAFCGISGPGFSSLDES